jgi:hypothetical protein
MLYWQARREVKRVGQTRTHSWTQLKHIHVYTSKSLRSLISGSLIMHTLLTCMQIFIPIILILLQDVSKRRERSEREITKDVLIISFMNN